LSVHAPLIINLPNFIRFVLEAVILNQGDPNTTGIVIFTLYHAIQPGFSTAVDNLKRKLFLILTKKHNGKSRHNEHYRFTYTVIEVF
jgi:hypothetical protein